MNKPTGIPNVVLDFVNHGNKTSLLTYQRFQRNGKNNFINSLLGDFQDCYEAIKTARAQKANQNAAFLNQNFISGQDANLIFCVLNNGTFTQGGENASIIMNAYNPLTFDQGNLK